MQEARDACRKAAEAVCDGLSQIGDFSYAILPKDIAHALGDFKKAVLGEIRCAGPARFPWKTSRSRCWMNLRSRVIRAIDLRLATKRPGNHASINPADTHG
jgi:hypothetical protein